MKSGLVVVYEIPSAAELGHRLLVPHSDGVTGDEAAQLVASIRGPVHVSADRIGVSRATEQHSRGTVRGATVVAVIAGIDVEHASPASIVAALSALEKSLDAAIAEASGPGATEHTTTVASQVAAQVRDSIAALGFRERARMSVVPQRTATDAPQPTSKRPVTSLPLLVGTLATLACGIAIGWVSSHMYGQQNAVNTEAPTIRPTETTAKSKLITAATPGADAGEVTPPPVLATTDDTAGALANATAASMPAPGADVAVAAPDERGAASVHVDPDPHRSAPQPAAEPEPDGAIVFLVECQGTEQGDRIQLLETADGPPIGPTTVAKSNLVSFEQRATPQVTSPEQIFVGFTEKLTRSFPNIQTSGGVHIIKRLSRIPGSDAYGCAFKLTDDSKGGVVRQIDVTVTARRSAD